MIKRPSAINFKLHKIIGLSFLLLGLISESQACTLDASANLQKEPITSQQATINLKASLVSLENSKADTSLQQRLDTIECTLSSAVSNYPNIKELKQAQSGLKELTSAIQSSNSLQQHRETITLINRSVDRDAGTGFVLFPADMNSTVELNLYQAIINPNCSEQPTTQCSEALSLAKNLWLIAGSYRSIANELNQQDKQDSLTFTDNLTQQWESYKDDTILLWPQEVLVNSLVFRPSQAGLTSPPNYKLLALRPSIGLSYLSDTSHRIQPTINIDLLGIYWWKYGGSDNIAAQKGRGVSTTLIWDGTDTSYGLTYHHNPKWSFTLARGDDNDFVISASIQLASWFVRN